MKAFVLAAGFGTRLKPLTDHIPKPLIPVLNIPCLFYTFYLLKQAGIREIICNTHHHADTIRRFIDSSKLSDLEISFSEEPVILGTGGGLKKCEKLLGDSEFILVNSDIITDIDFTALIAHHRQSKRAGTLTLFETPEAASIGYIGIEDGLVKDFRNLRNSGLVSSFIYTGTAVLTPEIFSYLQNGFSGIVDTGFTGLVDNGGLSYYQHEGVWMDIGTMANYWKANLDRESIISRMAAPMKRAIGMEPHRISPSAEISPDALISGSVIGRGCKIGPGCTITDSVLLPETEVRTGTTIINSVVDPFHTTIMGNPN
ncbi:NDP-sugar synthase [Chlorobium sp. BLA1]|uniref:sugar phosphate nucleotidyltransferase n=1 Tax=Candidatus Chlorobium masyuteum TaxID=2716876 RepID=UPI0014212AA7|nr:NDP-sugar synthase [Candidatus Chlorobium masyuteum]NHQ59772.1 NDP-sugar synthase [Candidatus Chlorobium masyuteum]NTU44947.1 NDP-sugar synthase [Chlorobiaceae bacterium]